MAGALDAAARATEDAPEAIATADEGAPEAAAIAVLETAAAEPAPLGTAAKPGKGTGPADAKDARATVAAKEIVLNENMVGVWVMSEGVRE